MGFWRMIGGRDREKKEYKILHSGTEGLLFCFSFINKESL